MMVDLRQFITELAQRGIRLTPAPPKLIVDGASGLTAQDRETIWTHKAELLAYLRAKAVASQCEQTATDVADYLREHPEDGIDPQPAMKVTPGGSPVPPELAPVEIAKVSGSPPTIAAAQPGLFTSVRIPVEPALKWAGGKRWLLPRLAKFWHPHRNRRLLEPFVGAASVVLGLAPKHALLNDINPILINLHRHLQRGLVVPDGIEFRYDQNLYYAHRERLNVLISRGDFESAELAALLYYLNHTGYNGLVRFNSGGGFNVPFGKYDIVNYSHDFSTYRESMWGWEISCGDFEQINLQPGDFLYADPPYDGDKNAFVGYSGKPFDWSDQERLADWLAKFDGPIVASNAATDRIVALYNEHDFKVEIIDAPRRISSDGDRTPAKEIFATRGLN